MFEAETVGYTIMLASRSAPSPAPPPRPSHASSLQHGLSFSDYGEQAFVLAQNLVLLVLLYRFAPPPLLRTSLLWGAYVALTAAFLSGAPCSAAAPWTAPLLSSGRSRACLSTKALWRRDSWSGLSAQTAASSSTRGCLKFSQMRAQNRPARYRVPPPSCSWLAGLVRERGS
jgi:hypothetical protein